jgi:biotin carboxyl carrier protein
MTYDIIVEDKPHRLELTRAGQGFVCKLDGQAIHVDAILARRDVLSLVIDGKSYEVKREQGREDLHLWVRNARYGVKLRDPRSLRSRRATAGEAAGPRKLIAPMPGKVVRILVEEGASVEAGQGVLVVEAMKMQNELKTPKSGVVQKITAKEGATVNGGDVLAIIE